MKKLILTMLLVLSTTAVAEGVADNAWVRSMKKIQDTSVYYTDENGYIQKWERPKRYEDWTYIDENGYDYTIKIIVK